MKRQIISQMQKPLFLSVLFIFVLFYSCKREEWKEPKAKHESAEVVTSWYRFVANMQRSLSPQPVYLQHHRNFGYIGVGLYEAVRPGIKKAASFSSVLLEMPAMPLPEQDKEYLWSASANAALASLFKLFLTGLTDADKSSIDAREEANKNQFRQLASDDVINRSEAFGRAVANAIYGWSAADNFSLSGTGYTISTDPGSWQPTPPAFANAVGFQLQYSRPFLAHSQTATAPPMPFSYSEDPSSEFYKAAKEVYDIGKTLTEEQKAIANWWSDVGAPGVIISPPYHTVGIITNLLEDKRADLEKAAVVYAKTGIAMKDGPINTFRSKFLYNLVRPVTYIRQHMDPTWVSYLTTPPYPEYPSGLMGVYAPVFQVLIREVGNISFTDDTYAWRGLPVRHYTSLSKMAEEAALSRVYAGLHYRFTQYKSLEMGQELGNVIADIDLKNEHQ